MRAQDAPRRKAGWLSRRQMEILSLAPPRGRQQVWPVQADFVLALQRDGLAIRPHVYRLAGDPEKLGDVLYFAAKGLDYFFFREFLRDHGELS